MTVGVTISAQKGQIPFDFVLMMLPYRGRIAIRVERHLGFAEARTALPFVATDGFLLSAATIDDSYRLGPSLDHRGVWPPHMAWC